MKKKSTKKRKPRNSPKSTFGKEVIAALREFLDELKKRPQVVVMPPAPAPIIIRLPNIGDDDNSGAPVPWKPTPGPGLPDHRWEVTCGTPQAITTTLSPSATASVRFYQ